MKHTLLAITILSISLFSCNKEVKPLSKEEIKQHIDSVSAWKMKEADNRAKIDLDHRIKIEVKVKVDSILNAQRLKAVKDTTKPAPAPTPAK